jgi:hypothetical protein
VHNSSFVLFDGAEFASYFDECQIDKSGRYLLIKANIDNSYDVDGIFMDLETGEYVTMSDQEGAPGHSDNGFGTVIASDNWAPVDCRFFRYDFKEIIDGAVRENLTIVYNTDGWANTAGCPQHLTWTNAKDTNIVPYEHQFLCGSNLADGEMAKHNEVVCFRPDASLDVLIVAPVLSFANASGGGYYYNKLPKAVIDKAGDYILWSSNMRSDRIDIFVARVPWHLLVAEEDYNPSLESPQTSGVPSTSAAPQTSSPSTSHQKANGGSSSVLNYANLIMIMMSAYSILF